MSDQQSSPPPAEPQPGPRQVRAEQVTAGMEIAAWKNGWGNWVFTQFSAAALLSATWLTVTAIDRRQHGANIGAVDPASDTETTVYLQPDETVWTRATAAEPLTAPGSTPPPVGTTVMTVRAGKVQAGDLIGFAGCDGPDWVCSVEEHAAVLGDALPVVSWRAVTESTIAGAYARLVIDGGAEPVLSTGSAVRLIVARPVEQPADVISVPARPASDLIRCESPECPSTIRVAFTGATADARTATAIRDLIDAGWRINAKTILCPACRIVIVAHPVPDDAAPATQPTEPAAPPAGYVIHAEPTRLLARTWLLGLTSDDLGQRQAAGPGEAPEEWAAIVSTYCGPLGSVVDIEVDGVRDTIDIDDDPLVLVARLPEQPDGIDEDTNGCPSAADAARRVTRYIEATGDGLYDVQDGAPLYARDLTALVRAARCKPTTVRSGPLVVTEDDATAALGMPLDPATVLAAARFWRGAWEARCADLADAQAAVRQLTGELEAVTGSLDLDDARSDLAKVREIVDRDITELQTMLTAGEHATASGYGLGSLRSAQLHLRWLADTLGVGRDALAGQQGGGA